MNKFLGLLLIGLFLNITACQDETQNIAPVSQLANQYAVGIEELKDVVRATYESREELDFERIYYVVEKNLISLADLAEKVDFDLNAFAKSLPSLEGPRTERTCIAGFWYKRVKDSQGNKHWTKLGGKCQVTIAPPSGGGLGGGGLLSSAGYIFYDSPSDLGGGFNEPVSFEGGLLVRNVSGERVDMLADDQFMQFMAEAQSNIHVGAYDVRLDHIPVHILRTWYNIFKHSSYPMKIKRAIVTGDIALIFEDDREEALEILHVVLDAAGLIPVIGELADGTNAIIYVAEGDYLNASFSGAALIPIVGDAAGKGIKYALKTVDATSPLAGRIRTLLKNASLTKVKLILAKIQKLPLARFDVFLKDLVRKPAIIEAIIQNPNLIDAWKLLDEKTGTLFRMADNLTAIKYVDNLKDGAKLGTAPRLDYRKTFKEEAFPEVASQIHQVHHAVPQKVKTKYGKIADSKLHSLDNLRGISKSNPGIHNQITQAWNTWYNANPGFTLQDALDYAKQIDDQFGHLFVPPIR